MSQCYLSYSCAYSTASSIEVAILTLLREAHASSSRRPYTTNALWSLIYAGNNVGDRQYETPSGPK